MMYYFSKGVRQGCPLSPVLFNLYINDIFDVIGKYSISAAKNKTNALMYADDLVLISTSEESPRQQIDGIQEYCQKWKLTINIIKTKSMVLSRGGQSGVQY